MTRGPGKLASAQSVHNRLRRLRSDTDLRTEAKALAKRGDTFGAMELLLLSGDVTEQHVEAHARWLQGQQMQPEDFV